MAHLSGGQETFLEGLEGLDPNLGINSLECAYLASIPKSASNPSNPSNSGEEPGANDLLNHCCGLDIRLWAEDGQLRYDAPAGVLAAPLRAEIIARKGELLALLTSSVANQPDPLDALSGPRRTPWGSLAWSDPDAPPIELFGPPGDVIAGPIAEPGSAPDPWSITVPRRRGS